MTLDLPETLFLVFPGQTTTFQAKGLEHVTWALLDHLPSVLLGPTNNTQSWQKAQFISPSLLDPPALVLLGP